MFLFITEDIIPLAWAKAVNKVVEMGRQVPTAYDRKGDPPSQEAASTIAIHSPFKEPRISKRIPCGLDDLEIYRLEVVHGIHDWWVNSSHTAWAYTYHERLFAYKNGVHVINQIESLINSMVYDKFFLGRRYQVITWNPFTDADINDPPCFCAGTKILTPIGERNVEDIRNGDLVYAYDLNTNMLVSCIANLKFSKTKPTVSVSFANNKIDVSENQLLYTNTGWKKARLLKSTDKIKVSTACTDATDYMIAGCLYGDGWLQIPGDKKRSTIGFSIHPKADSSWLKAWAANNTENKLREESRQTDSALVTGKISRKFTIDSKYLWEKFYNIGCPVGKKGSKDNQEIRMDVERLSDAECKDFLTGIFSSEGSICFFKNPNQVASIQLGMTWENCILLISTLLNRFDIKHKIYKNKTIFSIRIDAIEELRKAVAIFDFRLDSRKQAKYIKLVCSILKSIDNHAIRIQNINSAKILRSEGMPYKKIRGIYPNLSTNHWFKEEYTPKLKYIPADVDCFDTYAFVPVSSVESTGVQSVYDFEINHTDHTIVANGVAAHNCLQRLFFRIEQVGSMYFMHMHADWRSRDLWNAWLMNVHALTALQLYVCNEVSRRKGLIITPGYYLERCDSLHIYGKDLENAIAFCSLPHEKQIDAFNSTSQDVQDITEEARQKAWVQLKNEWLGQGRGVSEQLVDHYYGRYPVEWEK